MAYMNGPPLAGRTPLVAAVGPVVAEALRRRGIGPQLMPERSFFLKPLTAALDNALRG